MYRYPCNKAIRKTQEMIYTKFKICLGREAQDLLKFLMFSSYTGLLA